MQTLGGVQLADFWSAKADRVTDWTTHKQADLLLPTVSVWIYAYKMNLAIVASLDCSPWDMSAAMSRADMCRAPGHPLRCEEQLWPDVDVFVVRIDHDSLMARRVGLWERGLQVLYFEHASVSGILRGSRVRRDSNY